MQQPCLGPDLHWRRGTLPRSSLATQTTTSEPVFHLAAWVAPLMAPYSSRIQLGWGTASLRHRVGCQRLQTQCVGRLDCPRSPKWRPSLRCVQVFCVKPDSKTKINPMPSDALRNTREFDEPYSGVWSHDILLAANRQKQKSIETR
jgi:hypothetical protein